MQDKEMNAINFIMKEYETQRRDIWITRIKTLAELLISSLAIFVWLFFQKQFYNLFPVYRSILLMPLLIVNVLSWYIWIIKSRPITKRLAKYSDEEMPYGIDIREMYEQMKLSEYVYNKCKDTEKIIDITTALQFVYMIVASVLLIIY